MDRVVVFTVAIEIPFNPETSREYSDNPEIAKAFVDNVMQRVKARIRADGYISLSRILRALGIREQPDQPSIFFDSLDEWRMYPGDEGQMISLFLSGAFLNVPTRKAKVQSGPVEIVTKRDQNGKPIAGRYPFGQAEEKGGDAECPTGLRVISGSGESGKT